MINIMISGRRREGQALDLFYYEFEKKHVGLMKQARCDRFIKRYIQNKAIHVSDSIELWAKLDTYIDSQACLAFDDMRTMFDFFSDLDYNQIVKPHEFTDPNYMTFELSDECKIKSGQIGDNAVKVIYYFKAKPELSRDKFRKFMDNSYTKLGFVTQNELVVSHMLSYCLPEEETYFAKSSFQKAKISQYGVIDELWFKDIKDMEKFHQGTRQKLYDKLSQGINFENSFSLVVTDRVVFGSRP
jgi:hypothetical protein